MSEPERIDPDLAKAIASLGRAIETNPHKDQPHQNQTKERLFSFLSGPSIGSCDFSVLENEHREVLGGTSS